MRKDYMYTPAKGGGPGQEQDKKGYIVYVLVYFRYHFIQFSISAT